MTKNLLPAAASRVRSELPAVVGRTALDIEAREKGYAAVDTGEMRAGIYSVHGGLSATVSAPVEHSLYVEYGTSRMAPQPFIRPAVEAGAPAFQAAVAELIGRLA
ncbi:MAG: HK97-gp10 family putative phage morphogenesis protein [Thermomicrobiales bacterium]